MPSLMKIKTTIAAFVALTLQMSAARAEVLVQWSWENLTSASVDYAASLEVPCLNASSLSENNLSSTLFTSGGLNNSQFRCFDGWDSTNAYTVAGRTSLSAVAGTIAFDFATRPETTGSLSSLSLSLRRPDSVNSPTSVQASIFWEDALGQIQSATSGVLSIGAANTWTPLELVFSQFSAPLPIDHDFANQNFHVEVYAAGGNGGGLFVDNLTLNGQCAACVPEPGTLLGLGCAALGLMLRRRSS